MKSRTTAVQIFLSLLCFASAANEMVSAPENHPAIDRIAGKEC